MSEKITGWVFHKNDGKVSSEAELVDKREVEKENVNIDEIKGRKIGHIALFSFKDDEVPKAA